MSAPYYTLGVWRVKPGREDDFVAAWRAVGDAFAALSRPPGPGTLLRGEADPSLYYSFGPWDSLEAIEAMRADPGARAAIGRVVALCDEASPGTYRVVARSPEPDP